MERILVEMIDTYLGSDESDNGISLPVKEYKKGQRYILGRRLFQCFWSRSACIVITPKRSHNENKKIDPREENKLEVQSKPKKNRRKKKAKK
jgi:hypothetical protein